MAVPYRTLETLTRNHIIPEVVDQLPTKSPLMERMLKRKRKMTGLKVEQPVQYAYNPDAGAWRGGYAVMPFSTPEFATKATHEWTHYQVPAVWAETDLIKNMGEEEVADYGEAIVKNCVDSLMETFGRDLYKDGTANTAGAATIDGLAAICTHNSNPSPGNYGDIDRSSSTGSKSSYTGNAWWNAQVAACNAGSITRWMGTFNFSNSSTVIDMRKMNQFFLLFPEEPDAFFTSFALFGRLWDLNQANEKVERGNGGRDEYNVGARKIFINGKPVYADSLIDDEGKIYGLNFNYLFLRVGTDFEQSAPRVPTRMRVVGRYIFFDGQMTCSRPNNQGVITGATAQ